MHRSTFNLQHFFIAYSKIVPMPPSKPDLLRRFARLMGWTRSSYVILGLFVLTVFVIIYVWWPLAQMVLSYVDWQADWWRYFDWLLVGIFLFMSLVIMAGADLRRDGEARGLVETFPAAYEEALAALQSAFPEA